jgi:acylphosphatase
MSPAGHARLHALLHGRVQGVGCRYSIYERANDLDLEGWVANRADRTVELVAEGLRATLDSFLVFLNDGPGAARVNKIDVDWSPATGEFGGFDVR